MKKKRIIIISLLSVLLITWTILVVTNNVGVFDEKVYEFLRSFQSTKLDNFMVKFTDKIFNVKNCVIFCAASFILLLFKYKGTLFMGIAEILTLGFNLLTKEIIARPRPNHLRLIEEKGLSYPSGHAMLYAMLFLFIIYLINKSKLNKCLKILIYITLTLIVLVIGISRVYIGVHYPSDVVGGYLYSILLMYIYSLIIEKRKLL